MPLDLTQENALLDAACKGDMQALGQLLEEYQDQLYRMAYRLTGHTEDAAEVLQESFLKAARALPHFKGQSRFGTWLTRILLNECHSRLRSGRLRRTFSLNTPAGNDQTSPKSDFFPQQREPDPVSCVQQKETNELLQDALCALPEMQRELLILRDMESCDIAHIANLLDIPQGTVKSRLFRAREALRQQLASRGVTSQ